MEVDCIDGSENVVETLVVIEDIKDRVIDEDWLDCGVSRSAVFGVKPFESVLCHNAYFFDYTIYSANSMPKLLR
jgi:hypothetical protein